MRLKSLFLETVQAHIWLKGEERKVREFFDCDRWHTHSPRRWKMVHAKNTLRHELHEHFPVFSEHFHRFSKIA